MTGDNYIMSTGESAEARLMLLEKIYGPTTRILLQESGLCAGMKVVEIGCGAGNTACHIAETVGLTGKVVAVDISSEQLAVAKRRAAKLTNNTIDFIEANAATTGLGSGCFDLVYSRLLLTHVRDATSVMRECKRLLKVGGILACEDFVGPLAYSVPQTAVYSRLSELVSRFSSQQGVDYSIGNVLPQLVQETGFRVQSVRRIQPAFFEGDEKRWWQQSIAESGPVLQKAGFMTAEEHCILLSELEAVASDPTIMIAQPVLTQVRATNDLP
jgi:ubiquinone/menaquinone biosynthesis C-methylase UbiE